MPMLYTNNTIWNKVKTNVTQASVNISFHSQFSCGKLSPMETVIPRIISFKDFCLIYGQSEPVVKNMIKMGRVKVVPGSDPMRVYDPEWSAAVGSTIMTVADVYILKGVEVAELLGVTDRAVRMFVQWGWLKFKDMGTPGGSRRQRNMSKYRRYSINGVIECLEKRDQRRAELAKMATRSRPWLLELSRKYARGRGKILK